MLGDVDAAFAAAVERAAGGNPRLAVEIVRAASARAVADGAARPAANHVGTLDGHDLSALVAAALARLPPAARAIAEALAVIGRPAGVAELAALLDDDAAACWAGALTARAAGIVEADERAGALRFPSAAHAEAAPAALSPRRRLALHRRALALTPPDAVVDRARHLVALGAPDAAEAAVAAGERLIERGALRAAVAVLGDAARLGRGRTRLRAAARLGQARLSTGDYAGALAALAPVEAAGAEPDLALEATVAAARALQRAGDLDAAEARLRPLVTAAPSAAIPARARDEARGLYGRVLVARGDFARAAEVCATSEEPSADVAEARGLACLYLGRLDDADAAFAAVERAAAAHAPSLARARSLRGMVAHSRDALADAAELYQSALTLARRADDLHGAAIYGMNLAAILREAAEYERALTPAADAARDLGRLGKRLERAFALFNYGNLLLSIGDLEGAERAAVEVEALARATDATRELGYAHLLAGDVARRRGEAGRAVIRYRAGVVGARRRRRRRLARRRRSTSPRRSPTTATAPPRATPLAEARRLADTANQVDAWLPVALRVALRLGDTLAPADLAELARLRDRAARSARRDLGFRADVTLARGHIRRGEPREALACLARAARTWKEIRMRTPELRRDAIDDDPDARRLRELLSAAESPAPSPSPPPSPTPSLARALSPPSPLSPASPAPPPEPLRKLLSINKRLNSEQRLPVLLDLDPRHRARPDLGRARLHPPDRRRRGLARGGGAQHRRRSTGRRRGRRRLLAEHRRARRARGAAHRHARRLGRSPLRGRALGVRSEAALGPRRAARGQGARRRLRLRRPPAARRRLRRRRGRAGLRSGRAGGDRRGERAAHRRLRPRPEGDRRAQPRAAAGGGQAGARARRAAQGGALEPRRALGPLQL